METIKNRKTIRILILKFPIVKLNRLATGNNTHTPPGGYIKKKKKNPISQFFIDVNFSYQNFQPVKPKSWDNLTTKAFGGYGFGYGYVDTSSTNKNHSTSSYNASSNTMPAKLKIQSGKNTGMINLNQVRFILNVNVNVDNL